MSQEMSLATRLTRLERVVGSLLTFLAAIDIIGPEDFGSLVCELEAHRTREERPDGARSHALPPDKPP